MRETWFKRSKLCLLVIIFITMVMHFVGFDRQRLHCSHWMKRRMENTNPRRNWIPSKNNSARRKLSKNF